MAATEPLMLDIDLRLVDLWADVPDELDIVTMKMVGDFLRCAYGMGYCDALKETAAGTPGKLCRDHGYAHPLMEETT